MLGLGPIMGACLADSIRVPKLKFKRSLALLLNGIAVALTSHFLQWHLFDDMLTVGTVSLVFPKG